MVCYTVKETVPAVTRTPQGSDGSIPSHITTNLFAWQNLNKYQMKKLAILGLGHIGSYVLTTLMGDTNLKVSGYDLFAGNDLSSREVLEEIISKQDGVLVCTPFSLNKQIAELCNKLGVDYFDLTESVEVTDYVKTLNGARFITQCGLAPGMVSIIANHLARQFEEVSDIEIRVGALPENANNHMGYFKTWSTEGLINEYIHRCPALKNGAMVYLEPLADQENVTLNGLQLEAANTSGGIGSLCESYFGRADNVNYKTLRYPGHWNIMRFLKDDLGLKKNFNTYVKLFNENVPQTNKDCVMILIQVKGLINYQESVRQYDKIIKSNENTAIQITTAGGVMAVIDSWAHGNLDHLHGWISQENLDYQKVMNSPYAACYKI